MLVKDHIPKNHVKILTGSGDMSDYSQLLRIFPLLANQIALLARNLFPKLQLFEAKPQKIDANFPLSYYCVVKLKTVFF